MKKIFSVLTLGFFFCGLLMSPLAHADEPVATAKDLEKINKELMNEIRALHDHINNIENRVARNEERSAVPAGPAYVPAPGETSHSGGMLKTMEDINMSGFIDTSYNFNFNRPAKNGTNNNTNGLRVFDSRDGNFNLHAFEIDFEKLAPKTGGVGFRADLLYGMDALVTDGAGVNFDGATDGAGVGVGPDEFDLQQAYGEVNLPINGGDTFGEAVNLKAGKFVTLAGAEVIESKDNWNISRSFAFGFAIPFTHTGVRSSMSLFDGKVIPTLGFNNGWDLVQDTNDFKTLETGFMINCGGGLTFANVNLLGQESQTDANSARISDTMRYVTTNVVTWKTPIEKLTLMGDFDFGNQRNVASQVAGVPNPSLRADSSRLGDGEAAQWHAYDFYAKYDVTDKFYLAYRAELFFDNDSFRTFAGTTPRNTRRLTGHTVTADYRLYTNLISRLEYRIDSSDAGIYDVTGGGSTEGQGSQSTVATELIYLF